MNYDIEQRGGKWLIVHPNDPELTWSGRYWCDPELWDASPLTFADRVAAERYAEEIWGEQI